MLSDFFIEFSEFWAAWGPWISITLIPTLITGLSMSPRTKKAASVLSKLWTNSKVVLEVFSLATHKDQPGTFKLPFQSARKKTKKSDSDSDGGASSGACAAVFILAISSLPQAGCSWFQGDTIKNIGTGAINCTVQAIQSNARSLLPTVLAILTGKKVDWKNQLEDVGKEAGRDVLGCALVIASQELIMSVPASGSGAELDAAVQNAQRGVLKASEYINDKNWTFTEGQ